MTAAVGESVLSEAVLAAMAFLEKHEVDRFPVPVETLVHDEGIFIARKAFAGIQTGFALRGTGSLVIGLNVSTSPRRQRFIVAHELGHLLLHTHRALIVDKMMNSDMPEDRESTCTEAEEGAANMFAVEILMPRGMVRARLRRRAADRPVTRDKLIVSMAKEFEVSYEAMACQLVNLGVLT